MVRSEQNGQLLFEFERVPLALYSPDDLYEKMSGDEDLVRMMFEDKRVEIKPAGIHARELGEYFSMWANTNPDGGLIIVGIHRNKTVEGCQKLHPNSLNEIEKTAETYCPDAKYKAKRIPIRRDGDACSDFLVVFRVEYNPSRVVRTTDGRAFVRRADSKRQIKTPEEIRQLQTEKGEVQIETEPCGLDYPSEFDAKAIADFAETVRMTKRWDESHPDADVLSLMHLGEFRAGTFIPNIACALLFAKDPRKLAAGCRIRFLRFEGETERVGEHWNAVKDEFVDGTIPQQIQQMEALLKSQLRSFSRLGVGGRFFTSPEYPEFAWYEAVVNATAHRAYGNGLKNMPIFVKMFDDRLVVESPGPFPPFVTPENIYNVHLPRNPILMDAMLYLEFVKCAHEGTRRIRDEMLGMELPAPEFRQDQSGNANVTVTLRNNRKQRRVWVDSDVAELLGAQIAHSLSEDEKRCINFIAEYTKISVSDAQRLTGKSWPAARKMLGRLVDREILEHVRRDTDIADKIIERDPQASFRLRVPSAITSGQKGQK